MAIEHPSPTLRQEPEAVDDELRELKHALGCQRLLYTQLQRRFDDQHAQLVTWKKKFKDLGGTRKANLIRKLGDKLSMKESELIRLRALARDAETAGRCITCGEPCVDCRLHPR